LARVVKKPTERKEELLDIALRLFMQKGYADTSVKDIYTEANGSFGMFYHHFKSKEEIFEASMDKYVNLFIERLSEALLNEKLSYKERYRTAIDHCIELLDGRDKLSGFERGSYDVSVFRLLSLKLLSETIEPVQTYLEEGVKKEIIHVGDTYEAAIFIVYGIYGIIREEGIKVSNNKNAAFLLSKLSGLIARVLGSDAVIFEIEEPNF